MWVRGLKLKLVMLGFMTTQSRTLCGCVDWNPKVRRFSSSGPVAPYVGAWIETSDIGFSLVRSLSHPMWVRGLKLKIAHLCIVRKGRTLCGCVDWNLFFLRNVCRVISRTLCGCVDWNFILFICFVIAVSRTLCGCVDWNPNTSFYPPPLVCRTLCGCVDWNANVLQTFYANIRSHPMWVRGLKQ